MPLLALTVIDVELVAVTKPTKSSIRSNVPLGVPIRGSVATLKVSVALQFRATVPELTVIASFKFKFKEIPDACPAASVNGNGVEVTCDDPAGSTILQRVPVKHVPFSVAPDWLSKVRVGAENVPVALL